MTIKLIDIGKSEKGKVIHAITVLSEGKKKNNHAACDKRQSGLVVDANMEVTDITCSKCLQRADVKEALANLMNGGSAEAKEPEKTQEQTEKTAGLTAGAPHHKDSKKKQRGGAKQKSDVEILEEERKIQSNRPAITVQKDDITDTDGDFFARIKADGRYKIYHLPTGKVFFDSIPEEVAIDAICNLNTITDKWAKVEAQLPDNYIANCRKAIRDAFSKNNQTVPNNLKDDKKKKAKSKAEKKVAPASKTEEFKKGDKMLAVVDGKEVLMEHDGKKFVAVKKTPKKATPVKDKKPAKAEKEKRKLKRRTKVEKAEKPKRTIKRRGKEEKPKAKEKRVIKRRDRIETFLGRRKGTSGYTVIKAMAEGAQMGEIVSQLKKKHGQSEKRANTIIKGIVRKTSRKEGIPVTLVMGENPSEDFYKLTTGE